MAETTWMLELLEALIDERFGGQDWLDDELFDRDAR